MVGRVDHLEEAEEGDSEVGGREIYFLGLFGLFWR